VELAAGVLGEGGEEGLVVLEAEAEGGDGDAHAGGLLGESGDRGVVVGDAVAEEDQAVDAVLEVAAAGLGEAEGEAAGEVGGAAGGHGLDAGAGVGAGGLVDGGGGDEHAG
jgi:hypothetical protein